MRVQISKLRSYLNLILLLIILIAGVLRFFRISDTPPSLNWDEVSHAYNAYSVLLTGNDEWGNSFPVIFRAYGDYKLPVYIYLTSVSEYFLGLNAFAVRAPSAIAGIGTVIFTYLLVVELFSSNKRKSKNESDIQIVSKAPALIASLLVAVEPWTMFISRAAFEANLALFFFVSGVYFFVRGVRSSSLINILLSVILFGLSVWTYNSYRIFTPMALASLFVIFRKELTGVFSKDRKFAAVNMVLITLLFAPMFYQLLNPVGSARYSEVKILDAGTISKINEARAGGGSRLVHNKLTYFGLKFVENYFSHFSPQFLFYEGGSNYQFSIPGRGILYFLNMPFFLFGLYTLVKSNAINHKSKILILFWFFLAPIPSSITREAPHVLRSVTMLPVPMILSSLGLYSLLTMRVSLPEKLKHIIISGYLVILFILVSGYLKIYFGDYRKNYSWSWQYGYAELSQYITGKYSDYDKIIITKKYAEPHEFLLFYQKISPNAYLEDSNLNRFYQTNWYWVDSFDKYYFVNDWQINEPGKGEYVFNLESKKQVLCPLGSSRCLLVTGPDNVPEGWSKIKTLEFLDGKTAFELYENR